MIADDQIPEELGGSCPDMRWEWPFPEHTGCSAATLVLPLKNELKYAAETKAAEGGEQSAEGAPGASLAEAEMN